ncbi:MAG: hypothetical protein K6E21_03705 [Bacilli bacterium]|nr:hypothetical protein [Bacilli bacterium]
MKKRVFRGGEKHLDKVENYRKHFGWITQERHDNVLVMTFDNKQKYKTSLRNLEKQAEIINSKFPFRMIPWLTLAAIFLLLTIGFKDNKFFGFDFSNIIDNASIPVLTHFLVGMLPVVFIVGLGLNLFFAAYVIIVFLILKFVRHTTLEEIFRMADAMSKNVIDAPLKGNIEEKTEHTGVLAKMKIGSNNWNNKSA